MEQEDALARLVPPTSTTKRSGPIQVLGIDLGTTNSTIAELSWSPDQSNARARCLEVDQPTIDQGLYTHVMVPSIVAIKDGRPLVGEGAKRLRARIGELGLRQNRDIFFDCKNEIGRELTYHKAPEGYRSPTAIGAHVLSFLSHAADGEGFGNPDRIVVTVPASFQAAQRRETLRAAEVAGINLEPGDLLDEPLAAFLDMFVERGPVEFQGGKRRKHLVVFDFGGGTCDVAVFGLRFEDGYNGPGVAPLAVSRYHRLGGGDIDLAIACDVLLPQLQEQNSLAPLDLSYDEKKSFVLPSLLGIAERLKISLCSEVRRLGEFGRLSMVARCDIVAELPGQYPVWGSTQRYSLQTPRMNAEQFEDILSPFIDQDLLYPWESEYRSSCSIFAPMSDALHRARLMAEDVDFCLLIGGSSLIPQVQIAVSAYFKDAQVLAYDDSVDVQTAVAKGAAYHALMLEITGRALFQPVAHDDMSILTSAGLVNLVKQGDALPTVTTHDLAVPHTALYEPCKLRVEIKSGSNETRSIYSGEWDIPAPVSKGDDLVLTCTMDANQVITLGLRLAGDTPSTSYEVRIENPLTHIENPLRERLKIDEREEALRRGDIPRSQYANEFQGLASSYIELGQREKALEYYNQALRANGGPDSNILNRMGIVAGELKDFDRQEKYYREAAKLETHGVALFNLAFSQREQGRWPEARLTIEQALGQQRLAAFLVLAGLIAQESGYSDDASHFLAEAQQRLPSLQSLGIWELSWAERLGNELSDTDLVQRCRAERQRRSHLDSLEFTSEAALPDLKGSLVKVRP